MGQRVHRRKDDHDATGSSDPSLHIIETGNDSHRFKHSTSQLQEDYKMEKNYLTP
jgi:hypothetical protein